MSERTSLRNNSHSIEFLYPSSCRDLGGMTDICASEPRYMHAGHTVVIYGL